MTQPAPAFNGSIPALYHAHLGPVIFEPYARDMAARLDCPAGGAVLEVAAGTGIVTRHLLAAMPADASLVVTDLQPGMLEIAKQHLPADPRMRFEPADAQALPFPDASFDRVIVQFGVMFLPEKPKAFAEFKRVLRPGGRLVFNVWGASEDNTFAHAAHTTIAGFFAEEPPKFYEIPFGWHDERTILETLSGAGFRSPKLTWVDLDTTAVSAAHFSVGLVRGNPIVNEIEARGTASTDDVRAAVERSLIAAGGDQPWRGRLRALVVSASV